MTLKPGSVLEHDERLYRVWDRLPLAGTETHVLVCTKPDGNGGWDGPRIAITVDGTARLIEGDPVQLARLTFCARCGRHRKIEARRLCSPCLVTAYKNGRLDDFPTVRTPNRQLAGASR